MTLSNPNLKQDSEKDEEMSIAMNAFFERADAIISLANSQLAPISHAGQVTASLTYAAARFAVSSASIGFTKGQDLLVEKEDIIEFYVRQYRQMLDDNIEDYAKNFVAYTAPKQ